MVLGAFFLNDLFALHFRMVEELMAVLRTSMLATIKHCAAGMWYEHLSDGCWSLDFTHHGSEHPLSGHSILKSSLFFNKVLFFGCRSHLTGRPL